MSLEYKIGFQYWAPQRLFAKIAHFCAENRTPWFRNALIKYFLSRHAVHMEEAVQEDPYAYESFNAFFTRLLKPSLRPIAAKGLVSPADGMMSQYGDITEGFLVQAKGQWFHASELVGDLEDCTFDAGSFFTIYLAPHDYHRVHLPFTGRLSAMRYVPGRLMSVSTCTSEEIPRLFARNERVIAFFETEHGKMAVVLVGAMIVGNIAMVWHGLVNHGHDSGVLNWNYPKLSSYSTGADIGHFRLGSTVIVLTEKRLHFEETLTLRQSLKMGVQLATFKEEK